MLEKNADVNCCFLCSVIFIEYYSTMHCNEVLQACQVDPIYCDIFGAAERVLRYGLPINLRYIFKRVPALCSIYITPPGDPSIHPMHFIAPSVIIINSKFECINFPHQIPLLLPPPPSQAHNRSPPLSEYGQLDRCTSL